MHMHVRDDTGFFTSRRMAFVKAACEKAATAARQSFGALPQRA